MNEKNFYLDALIAMAFFAVLFFLILVVILAVWCKKRRQTEVKTVVIQPKKRPVSTKPMKQANGGSEHRNVEADVEAGAVTSDEIELSDGQDEERVQHPETPEHIEQKLSDNTDEPTAHIEQETSPVQAEQGEINPSFENDNEEPSKAADDDAPAS